MKEIIFVRHAKSDWGNEVLKDVDRPLSERGYSDAYFLAEWYLKKQSLPDLMISSTATRAVNTALIFARAWEYNMAQFRLEESIYESSSDTILKIVKKQPSHVNRLMLFGHNPGFTNVCNEVAIDDFFDNVPTCGLVSFLLDIKDWSEDIVHKGKLNYYQFPKDFKNRD